MKLCMRNQLNCYKRIKGIQCKVPSNVHSTVSSSLAIHMVCGHAGAVGATSYQLGPDYFVHGCQNNAHSSSDDIPYPSSKGLDERQGDTTPWLRGGNHQTKREKKLKENERKKKETKPIKVRQEEGRER
ncbi:hypothetical protein V6N13_114293 [Hibiscus sabdariffa]